MDINRLLSHRRSRGKARKGNTARLAAQLAPLEEQDKQAAVKQAVTTPSETTQGQAAAFSGIVVESADLRAAKDMLEGGGEKTFLGMEPVVLVILGVMLLFIAFIAWQISQMPVE